MFSTFSDLLSMPDADTTVTVEVHTQQNVPAKETHSPDLSHHLVGYVSRRDLNISTIVNMCHPLFLLWVGLNASPKEDSSSIELLTLTNTVCFELKKKNQESQQILL